MTMNNDPSIHSPGTSSLAMVLLFGSITFATASLAAKSWLVGDTRCFKAGKSTVAEPLDVSSFVSLYSLLYQLTVFGLILLFAYICEYHPPFPHSEKSYDRDQFFMLIALLFIASACTVTKNEKDKGKNNSRLTNTVQDSSSSSAEGGASKSHDTAESIRAPSRSTDSKAMTSAEDTDVMEDINLTEDDIKMLISRGYSGRTNSQRATSKRGHAMPSIKYPLPIEPVKPCNDVLNRDQTEEWKGWMQFIFLLYHYYNAEELYNSIRVMITCYVWMTGFGNFSFFYIKNDFSFVRVLQMLWRLNFLVIFLCLSQGTTYILYYICPLHTYYFLLVYATMRIGSHLNHTRYGIRLKLLVVAVSIFLIWDVDAGLFRLFHFPFFGQTPQLGATSGALWEWYFRTSLDHWSTLLGMVFASNFPIVSLFYRKLESQHWARRWAGKSAVGAGLLLALYFWWSGPFLLPKFDYNRTNSYFGIIPLISYIYFRNLTPVRI
jgi:hypothetical protein